MAPGSDSAAFDFGLQGGAGGEARHFATRDRDPLAGAGVHALTRSTLGDVEFAEAGEADLVARRQCAGDRVEDGVDGVACRFFAPQTVVACQLVQKLSLGHVEIPPRGLKMSRNLTTRSGGKPHPEPKVALSSGLRPCAGGAQVRLIESSATSSGGVETDPPKGTQRASEPAATTARSIATSSPAMVNSRTGSANAPSLIARPEAPTEKTPVTGLTPEWRPATSVTKIPSPASASSSSIVWEPVATIRFEADTEGRERYPARAAEPVEAVPSRVAGWGSQ